jgi:glutamine synthetase
MSQAANLNANTIARYLDKAPADFTKADIIKFVEENGIAAINFRHLGGDGRLKTLNFIVNSREQLDQILSAGERVDGSSLFSYIDSASSDLYVVPRYRTAFVNPFATIPSIDILGTYFTKEGERLASSPENILKKAQDNLKEKAGLRFEAMGELEYYVIAPRQHLYPTVAQKGYQESAPFCKWETLRYEAMNLIAQAGGKIKYGHSEVGHISSDDHEMEQNEIEFSPVDVEDAADQLVVAKWILRMLGRRNNVTLTFAPKILVGHAGSGMHVHTRVMKGDKNMLVDDGKLNDFARRVIAGYLKLAPSLTAFGNTIPLSFLRLVPHQEAPTNVCWGDRNRSGLVRVPLGWLHAKDMAADANLDEAVSSCNFSNNQTVEFRSPDGSANIHLLMAGLAVAVQHGLEMENALDLAKKLYVDVNIFASSNKDIQSALPQLPTSCWDAADCLLEDRAVYEKDGIFPASVIDGLVKILKHHEDKDLSERFYGKGDEIQKMVDDYIHI